MAGDTVYVLLGKENRLVISRSTDGGRTFNPGVKANRDAPAWVLPVEQPAIATDESGRVSVAWLDVGHDGETRVWYARSEDGGQSFGPSQLAGATEAPETIMIGVAVDADHQPVLSWLENSTLRIARSFDSGASFPINQQVDDLVCECCQPRPLVQGSRVFVAYRNREKVEGGREIRDIYVAASDDNAQSFASSARVSDAPWYLSACPISAPSMTSDGERLYVSWMDGRNDTSGNFSKTDIWLASSSDGGQTFSDNVRVSPEDGHYNNAPALAVGTDGRLHIVWEAHEPNRLALYYAVSGDGDRSFSAPQVLVSSETEPKRGRPGTPALAASETGRLYLAWVDHAGARLAAWDDQ